MTLTPNRYEQGINDGYAACKREMQAENEQLRALATQWETLAVRAQPSITSDAWQKDFKELRVNQQKQD